MNVAPPALISTAVSAFQPKVAIMKLELQPQRLRHHHDRRRGEIRHHAADRDVDEQHAERDVHEPHRRVAAEELLAQQQSGERHRGRLGDERAEQRADRKRREVVAGRGRQRQQARHEAHRGAGEIEHRTACGDHHDDEHEGRLGEAAAFEIGERVLGAEMQTPSPPAAPSPRSRTRPRPRRADARARHARDAIWRDARNNAW